MCIGGINSRKRPNYCEILKVAIHETFHQLSNRKNLVLTEFLSLLRLYLAFLSTLHGHILLIRSGRRFLLSDKTKSHSRLFSANHFAVSSLHWLSPFSSAISSSISFTTEVSTSQRLPIHSIYSIKGICLFRQLNGIWEGGNTALRSWQLQEVWL